VSWVNFFLCSQTLIPEFISIDGDQKNGKNLQRFRIRHVRFFLFVLPERIRER